jgi:acyl-coenzyme A synthetase/AMP-(fatty) acid ligase
MFSVCISLEDGLNFFWQNLFGSTECGAMLLSIGGKSPSAQFLRPIDGMSYSFMPIDSGRDKGHHSTARMLELVILADSPDCPDKTLRHEDGHFHTGDLFIEAAPGSYVFRGRNDDWIKTETSLRCDTKCVQ